MLSVDVLVPEVIHYAARSLKFLWTSNEIDCMPIKRHPLHLLHFHLGFCHLFNHFIHFAIEISGINMIKMYLYSSFKNKLIREQ